MKNSNLFQNVVAAVASVDFNKAAKAADRQVDATNKNFKEWEKVGRNLSNAMSKSLRG